MLIAYCIYVYEMIATYSSLGERDADNEIITESDVKYTYAVNTGILLVVCAIIAIWRNFA